MTFKPKKGEGYVRPPQKVCLSTSVFKEDYAKFEEIRKKCNTTKSDLLKQMVEYCLSDYSLKEIK